MKTYSRINTMDVEHSRAPKSNDGFVFSDDIGKWMHSGQAKSAKAQRDKFYDDAGNVVPLEFGNKEQFSILQRADKWITEAEEVDTDYHFNKNGDCTGYHHEWWCLCGNNVRANNHRDMPGRKYKCKECGNRFEIDLGEYGEMVVRILKIAK